MIRLDCMTLKKQPTPKKQSKIFDLGLKRTLRLPMLLQKLQCKNSNEDTLSQMLRPK